MIYATDWRAEYFNEHICLYHCDPHAYLKNRMFNFLRLLPVAVARYTVAICMHFRFLRYTNVRMHIMARNRRRDRATVLKLNYIRGSTDLTPRHCIQIEGQHLTRGGV